MIDARDKRIASLEAQLAETKRDRDRWFSAALENKLQIDRLSGRIAKMRDIVKVALQHIEFGNHYSAKEQIRGLLADPPATSAEPEYDFQIEDAMKDKYEHGVRDGLEKAARRLEEGNLMEWAEVIRRLTVTSAEPILPPVEFEHAEIVQDQSAADRAAEIAGQVLGLVRLEPGEYDTVRAVLERRIRELEATAKREGLEEAADVIDKYSPHQNLRQLSELVRSLAAKEKAPTP